MSGKIGLVGIFWIVLEPEEGSDEGLEVLKFVWKCYIVTEKCEDGEFRDIKQHTLNSLLSLTAASWEIAKAPQRARRPKTSQSERVRVTSVRREGRKESPKEESSWQASHRENT